MQEGIIVPTRGKASTKGSCAAEDEEEDNTNTDTSYRCKLFVGDPPRLVAIGRVFSMSSTFHTMPLGDDLARVFVEEVREADAEVLVPTSQLMLTNTFCLCVRSKGVKANHLGLHQLRQN